MSHDARGRWLPDWLRARARDLPHRPAVVSGDVRLTFAEVDRRATHAARQLAFLGVTRGTRVATASRGGASFVVLTHALARLGAVMVPLNVRLAAPEMAWRVADSRAAVVISDAAAAPLVLGATGHTGSVEPTSGARACGVSQYARGVRTATPEGGCAGGRDAPRGSTGVVLVLIEGSDGPAGGETPVGAPRSGGPDPVVPAEGGLEAGAGIRRLAELPAADVPLQDHIDLSAVQGILYTSATSGRPKGVLLTYGNHWWNAVGSALNLGVYSQDRWLAPLPLYHVGGLAIVWRSVIYGIPMVIHDTFDPDAVNREIEDGRITLVSVVPTMLERVLDARGARPWPPTLRCVLLGGGPVRPALVEACLRRGVPVAPTYGLTEAASQVATLPPEEAARKPGSAGRALLPLDIRIERTGDSASPEEVGEILVRGPTVMRGYADRPAETARALRHGWLHTGDLGYLDDEGYLYVVDRRDDLVVSGGENIYPAEVEAVLRAHPGVADAAVVGLPDAQWGHVAAAVVRIRAGAQVSEDDLRVFCEGRLARYKIPRHVWFSDDALPRSGGGKLLRRVVREWALAAWRRRR